jgi:hypothetical protein
MDGARGSFWDRSNRAQGFPQKRRFPTGWARLQLRWQVAILGQLQQGGNGRFGVSLAYGSGLCYSWKVADEQ